MVGLLAVLIICAVVIAWNWNQILLDQMTARLVDTVSDYDEIELLDTRSVYGKLNGNGNGIQFFGAVLVRASSDSALQDVVEELSDGFEVVDLVPQKLSKIESKYLEHAHLEFQHPALEEDGDCYRISFFCSEHEYSVPLDIRGH